MQCSSHSEVHFTVSLATIPTVFVGRVWLCYCCYDEVRNFYRDAVSDLALHFLEKLKILTVREVEREEIEFICKTLGCRPIASLDHFTADNLCTADVVEEINCSGSRLVKVGILNWPSGFREE